MLSILAKIGFDWQVALANLVNFIIILFVLRKFAFNPIKEAISKRQSIIDAGLENAKIAETDRVMAEELKKNTLKEARMKADEIIGEAHKKAELILAKTKTDAEVLKKSIIDDGQKELEKRKQDMDSKFKERSANMIYLGVEKILGQKMTSLEDSSYIERQ